MAPFTALLDGLNKPLTNQKTIYYFNIFNKLLAQSNQTPLNTKRSYVIQVARFDPSKRIPDVLEVYRKLRTKLKKDKATILPQLVIAGHGAVDDPEGAVVYHNIKKIINRPLYEDIKDDIKIAYIPPSDQILNILLENSMIALQLSYKEGFEVKVTEALKKGKPIIAYRTGGIPLQIENKITDYLAKTGNINKVVRLLYKLFINKKLYSKMSQRATKRINHDFFTVANASEWLYLATELLEQGSLNGKRQYVKKLIKH